MRRRTHVFSTGVVIRWNAKYASFSNQMRQSVSGALARLFAYDIARCQPRREAGAQRTLYGVGCTPLFGAVSRTARWVLRFDAYGLTPLTPQRAALSSPSCRWRLTR